MPKWKADHYVQQKRGNVSILESNSHHWPLLFNHPAFHAAAITRWVNTNLHQDNNEGSFPFSFKLVETHWTFSNSECFQCSVHNYSWSQWWLIMSTSPQLFPMKEKSIFKLSVDINCERFESLWACSPPAKQKEAEQGQVIITNVLLLLCQVHEKLWQTHSGWIGLHTQKSQQASVQYIVLHDRIEE